jgi:homoserine kinase
MPYSYAEAFAPATVANVGPGFDVFGFALDGEGAGDTVEIRLTEKKGVRIREITGDGGKLPRDPSKNVASAVAMKMLRDFRPGFGVEVSLHKGLPLGSGLGSSSASAVAAAVAMNGIFGGFIAPQSMLDYARFGEKVACGAAHADNVAPALYGGFTLLRPIDKGDVEVVRLQTPKGWYVAVVHPHMELPTKKARAALPKQVSLSRMTANAGNAAAVVAALAKENIKLCGRALMGDTVVVPARKKFIRGFDDVMMAALKAGAAGASISGAGPSLFALTDSRSHAKVVAEKMARAWKRRGIGTDVFVSPMGGRGARIIERR